MSGILLGIRSLFKEGGKLLSSDKQAFTLKCLRNNVIDKRITNYYATLVAQSGQISKRPNSFTYLEQRRFKKKKANPLRQVGKGADQEDVEDGDESDDDELANENPLLVEDFTGKTSDGSDMLTININSLRLDAFCKTAFSTTRTKVEEAFYKGDIFINGELPHKKSIDVSSGDEIDYIKNINPEDTKKVNVKRAVIVRLPDKSDEHGRVKIDIKRWNDLIIDSPHHRERKDDG